MLATVQCIIHIRYALIYTCIVKGNKIKVTLKWVNSFRKRKASRSRRYNVRVDLNEDKVMHFITSRESSAHFIMLRRREFHTFYNVKKERVPHCIQEGPC